MKKDSFMKDALILFAITLISGLLLGGVNELTKGPIADAAMAAKSEAYKVVYPDAVEFTLAENLTDAVASSEETLASCGFGAVLVDDIVNAVDGSGNTIGYVVTATSKEGFGGNIQLTCGVSTDGAVQGIEFLSLSETAGLGMNAQTPEFKGQFTGKAAESLKVTKSGSPADDEIQAISGATITSNAVTNAVNAALYFVKNCAAQ